MPSCRFPKTEEHFYMFRFCCLGGCSSSTTSVIILRLVTAQQTFHMMTNQPCVYMYTTMCICDLHTCVQLLSAYIFLFFNHSQFPQALFLSRSGDLNLKPMQMYFCVRTQNAGFPSYSRMCTHTFRRGKNSLLSAPAHFMFVRELGCSLFVYKRTFI